MMNYTASILERVLSEKMAKYFALNNVIKILGGSVGAISSQASFENKRWVGPPNDQTLAIKSFHIYTNRENYLL